MRAFVHESSGKSLRSFWDPSTICSILLAGSLYSPGRLQRPKRCSLQSGQTALPDPPTVWKIKTWEIAKLFFTISSNPGPVIQTSAGSRFRSIAKLFFTISESFRFWFRTRCFCRFCSTVILMCGHGSETGSRGCFPAISSGYRHRPVGNPNRWRSYGDDNRVRRRRWHSGERQTLLFRVKWRRIERLVAVGANRFPGFHLGLRAWIGPVILCQEKSNQE